MKNFFPVLATVFCISFALGSAAWFIFHEQHYPDVLIVQYNTNGDPINCFVVKDKNVQNKDDHILIWDSSNNIEQRISGPVSAIELKTMSLDEAAGRLRVSPSQCK